MAMYRREMENEKRETGPIPQFPISGLGFPIHDSRFTIHGF